jgi:hypothetical protein
MQDKKIVFYFSIAQYSQIDCSKSHLPKHIAFFSGSIVEGKINTMKTFLMDEKCKKSIFALAVR